MLTSEYVIILKNYVNDKKEKVAVLPPFLVEGKKTRIKT